MTLEGERKKEYQREWIRARRTKALEYLGGKCVSCGSTKNLEFDHIDREHKKFSVNKLLSRRWEVQVEELDKCQILCQDCHLLKTSEEIPRAVCGTLSRYSSGCRCRPCKDANALRSREYRSR